VVGVSIQKVHPGVPNAVLPSPEKWRQRLQLCPATRTRGHMVHTKGTPLFATNGHRVGGGG
jgi:hypothetical protein